MPNHNDHNDFDSLIGSLPEKGQPDKERLRSVGDLLVDVSTLIELINAHNKADNIDYRFVFPILPFSSTVFPEALDQKEPDYIIITAGKTKLQEQESSNPTIATSLSVEITVGEKTYKISRDSDGENDSEETNDIIFDMSQKGSSSLSLRDEIRGESEQEFIKRISHIPKIPRHELNSLLMSLALPNNGDYTSFKDKDLLNPDIFNYLIEAFRTNALEAGMQGTYLFHISDESIGNDIELNFEKKDNDESFTVSYTDPKTDRVIIVTADTESGLGLKFYEYDEGLERDIDYPTTDQIKLIGRIIHNELETIFNDNEVIGEFSVITTNDDPEKIALNNVDRRDKVALRRLYREINNALGQDGFDPPDTSA